MIVWLIRHAVAADAGRFNGDDLERPLTAAGRKQAERFFRHLATVRPAPDRIIASEAVRARQTAEIIARTYNMDAPEINAALNPGCRLRDIRKIIDAVKNPRTTIALVGHEPDLSNALSKWTAAGCLDAAFAKCALAELDVISGKSAGLRALLPPDLAGAPLGR